MPRKFGNTRVWALCPSSNNVPDDVKETTRQRKFVWFNIYFTALFNFDCIIAEKNELIRMELFSDAIFAIAATLLILEIKVPSVSAGSITSEIWRELGIYGLPILLLYSASEPLSCSH